MSSGKLKLTITENPQGQRVHLKNMSLKESRILVDLLEALNSIIEQSTDNEDIKLKIVEGSIELVADTTNEVIDEIEAGFRAVTSNHSANRELVEGWRKVQDLVKANGYHYQAKFFRGNDSVSILDTLQKSRRFKTKSTRRKAEYELLFIDGQLIENGGKVPNLHVVDKAGNRFTIDCTESEARKVNSLLYQPIKLTAWSKKTSIENYSFCDFYLEKYVFDDLKDFIKSNLDDYDRFLNNIHNKIRGYLDDRDFKTLRQFIKLFNHLSVEPSTLKTILIITKSFRDDDGIKVIREEIKELLERKLGKQLI